MIDKKKSVLIIDDHFESLEFVRSVLQLSNRELHVVCVPSAEEGLLELRLQTFELIITDIRLPGINGIDLIKRAKRIHSNVPFITISGHDDILSKDEMAQYGVLKSFSKPLDTDGLLQTVQQALYGSKQPVGIHLSSTNIATNTSPAVSKRLELLKTDTGAVQVALARIDGLLLFHTDERQEMNVPALLKIIAQNMGGSFNLARQLGSEIPFAVQYQTGQKYDVYSANIGWQYVMALFFQAETRRGRIGTVWVFAQRAIIDLLPMLEAIPTPETVVAKPIEAKTVTPEVKPTPLRVAPKRKPTPQPPAKPTVKPESTDPTIKLPALDEIEQTELDNFWEEAIADVNNATNSDLVSFESAQAQGLLRELMPAEEPRIIETSSQAVDDEALLADFAELVTKTGELPADLDNFWSDAITDAPSDGQGLSWEEAIKQGLVSTDLGSAD